MRTYSCFRFVAILVIIVLCVTQLIFLSLDFAKLETSSDFTLSLPDSVRIPAVTFCTDYPSFINYTNLSEKYPEFVSNLKGKYKVDGTNYVDFVRANGKAAMQREVAQNFTLKELMSVLNDVNRFVQVYLLPSPTNYSRILVLPTEIQPLCQETTYLRDNKVCTTFSCYNDKATMFSFKRLNEGRASGSLIGFSLNHTIFQQLPGISVYLHPPKTLARGFYLQAMNLAASTQPKIYPFTYRRYNTKLLPSPYDTNCRDYSKEGFESRTHKVQTCENLLSIRDHGFIIPSSIRFANDTSAVDASAKVANFESSAAKIKETCEGQHIQPDCYFQDYIPSAFPTLDLKVNRDVVLLKSSREPDIVGESLPKKTTLDFVTSICSIIAFWSLLLYFVHRMTHNWKKEHEVRITDNNNIWKMQMFNRESVMVPPVNNSGRPAVPGDYGTQHNLP